MLGAEAVRSKRYLDETRPLLLALTSHESVRASLSVVSTSHRTPPSGSVMGDPPIASRTGAGLTMVTATDAEMDAARKALPKAPPQNVRALAQRYARAKHPHLFEAGGDPADPIV